MPKDSGSACSSWHLAKFRKSRALRNPKVTGSSERLAHPDRSKYCSFRRQLMLAGIIFKEVFEIINVCKFKRRFKNLGMVEIGRPEASRYRNSFSL